MTQVKVCGITRTEDAAMLVELGVNVIGLNFWPQSKRYIAPKDAQAILSVIRGMQPETSVVGVFVNQSAEEIESCRSLLGLDGVQLHGDESVSFAKSLNGPCVKALPLASRDDLKRAADFAELGLLVDSHSKERGGSGIQANWELAKELAQERDDLWLAGGLRPDNVQDAIESVGPFGVDLASGVESSPGIKSRALVEQFMAAVKGCV